MGKSSPTKLQLKHIPDVVIMQTVYTLQNTWTVWVGAGGGFDPLSILDVTGRSIAARSLSYRQKKTAHLAEICEVLRPLPEKLVWRKLQSLKPAVGSMVTVRLECTMQSLTSTGRPKKLASNWPLAHLSEILVGKTVQVSDQLAKTTGQMATYEK
jgi:16S rRNA G527 N7-methylase RsmG